MSCRYSICVRRGKVCESSFPLYWLQECPRNQSGRDKDSERILSGICGEVAEWMRTKFGFRVLSAPKWTPGFIGDIQQLKNFIAKRVISILFWSIVDIGDLSCWNIKKIIRKCMILLIILTSYRRLPARRDLFWEDYARSSSRKKVTWIEMIITPKIMAYFWQFSFCIHKNIQVFIWKRLQSQFSLITGEKLRKNL